MGGGSHRRATVLGSAMAVVFAVFGAGCGGSGVAGPSATQVVTVPGHPQHITSLRAVQQASIPVANLSWLSFYQGFVWVKRDDGFVTRIDPRSNQPSGQVGTYTDQQHYCQGIGAGGGAVWSCSGSNITRIDPKLMKIVASIPVGKVFDQGRLVFADGQIWVVTGRNGDQLVGIDAATNRPGPAIKLPVGCSDLANLAPGTDAVSGPLPARQQGRQGRPRPSFDRGHARAGGALRRFWHPDGSVGWIRPGPGPGRRQEP